MWRPAGDTANGRAEVIRVPFEVARDDEAQRDHPDDPQRDVEPKEEGRPPSSTER
jgi:hypothetical protein